MSGPGKESLPSAAADWVLAFTRTLTTAGLTFSTTSAKLGTCGAWTRTASAKTGTVPVATAPRPMEPAIATEATAAIRRLRVLEWGEGAVFIDLVSSRTGCAIASSWREIERPTLRAPFQSMKLS